MTGPSAREVPNRRAVLAGVVAAAGGMASAELVTGALSLRTSPLISVGEWVIELTPGAVAEFFIRLVGQADKPLLVSGVVLALLGFGALAGVLGARRRAAGMGLLAVLGAVGAVAAVTREGAGALNGFPALVATVVAMPLLNWLLGVAGAPQTTSASVAGAGVAAGPGPGPSAPAAAGPSAAAGDFTRRAFLLRAGVAGAAAVLATGAGRWLARGRDAVEAARRSLKLPVRDVPVPAGVSVGVAGVSPWLTPTDDFYRIDTALTPPLLTPQDWRLRVHGMVDRELDISFAHLLERKVVDAFVTLCCVSNPVGGPLISNTRWTGVRIADLLAEAGPQAGADAVLSRSVDGWTCGTPLLALTDDRDSLLAFAMDGRALPVEHGFPVRMVVPGLYGYVSATKWVVDLEVTRFADFAAYWTDRGWAEQAPIKTSSRIDVPREGASVAAGRVAVGGVAWAQHRGIDAVEVRVDGGPWERATLAGEPTIDTWRQWRWDWAASAGDHELYVRAIDSTGAVQTGDETDVMPDGATGWHHVSVRVG